MGALKVESSLSYEDFQQVVSEQLGIPTSEFRIQYPGTDARGAPLRDGAIYSVMIQGNGGMDVDTAASKDNSINVATKDNGDGQLTYSQEVWRCMQEYLDSDVTRLLVEQLKQHPVVARRACHVRLTDNFLLETVEKFNRRVPVVHPGRVTLWLLKPKEDWVPRGMSSFKAVDCINLLGQRVVTSEARQWDHVTNTLVLDRITIDRYYTRAQHDKLDRILAELGIVGIKSKGIRTKIKAIMEWAPLAWSRRIGNTPVNLSTDMTGAEVYAQFPSPNTVQIEYKARDRDPWQVMPRDDTSLRSLGIMRKSARFKKSNTGATVV